MGESDEGLVREAQTGQSGRVWGTGPAYVPANLCAPLSGHGRPSLRGGSAARDLDSRLSLDGPAEQSCQFAPWLLTIAQNVLAEAVRRQTRQKRMPPPRAESHSLAEVPSPLPTPIEVAEQTDTHDLVLGLLRSLPEEYRSVLTLRYLAGCDYETIETQLGLSNGALRPAAPGIEDFVRARLEDRRIESPV